jgi:hypothetical protein
MKKIVLLIAVIALNTQSAFAVSATAKAKQVVISALNISKSSDLEFGEAPQGDSEKTVAPTAAETADNASFAITGEPGKSISVTLPADNTIKMITGVGGTDKEINVNAFKANFLTSTIAAGGTTNLFVGATRDALSTSQATGSYEGNFDVTVVY